MTYSPEHIKAVNDRLEEYRKTIETGIFCLDLCKICRTVSVAYSCAGCLLDKMPDSVPGCFPCMTETRRKMLNMVNVAEGVILDPPEIAAVKARYDELTKHLEGK